MGGHTNKARGDKSFIGAGISNATYGSASAILGGNSNSAITNYSVVGGGSFNTVSGIASSVFGGSANTVSGTYSSVLGGNANVITKNFSTIVAGRLNTVTGFSSGIGAGNSLVNSFDNTWMATNMTAVTMSAATFYSGNTSLELIFAPRTVAAGLYRSGVTSFTFTSANFSAITYNAVNYKDTEISFTAATGVIKTSRPGRYFISASVGWGGSAAQGTMGIKMQKSGTDIPGANAFMGPGSANASSGSTCITQIVSLDANDYIRVLGNRPLGTATFTLQQAGTHFEIHQIA
jgi:hypothetical protein